jgi:solute carrier family 13 (sodium-dependent dicarboxylate transporter), member 2/3/5
VKTFHEALAGVEVYSPSEELFNRRRRTVGMFLGPATLFVMLVAPLPLTWQAHRMAAILAMVVVLWITEALPIAVTAMLGPVLAVVFQVAPARAALAPFADPIIFLFIGGFILAEAMFVHGVDRRIAYTALSWRAIGRSGARILVVYGAVGTALSMWISNTATTAMLFPIGLSIVAHLSRSGAKVRGFAIALMLITSFGPSIGGMATPVGTPPNLIGIGMLERIAHIKVSFFQWMAIGLPCVVLMYAFVALVFCATEVRGVTVDEGSTDLVRDELRKLGPLSVGQRNVLIAFGVTVLLWVAPGILTIAGLDETSFAQHYSESAPEGVAAMIGAFLLFVLPLDWRSRRFTLTWDEASRIDWGIVFLYGGGLAMGTLAFSTGLA